MQYNKSLKGQAPSCQCLLQGKEVLMGDKSDHMIAANDEISFLKESNPTGQKPLPEKRSPTLNLKPLFFPGRRPDGILRHRETLQLETEWLIYTPAPHT